MEMIRQVIRQMIQVSEAELDELLRDCVERTVPRKTVLSIPGKVPQEIYFINRGLIRVIVTDNAGVDHSLHFALEGQFVADYSSFILKQPSLYTLQTEEETELVVMPRSAVEWGYAHMEQGDRMGRLIAEYYYIYQDNRLKNLYARTAKERYDAISDIFPNIHNRVPQHMIASYLGISSVHLSRLKQSNRRKV